MKMVQVYSIISQSQTEAAWTSGERVPLPESGLGGGDRKKREGTLKLLLLRRFKNITSFTSIASFLIPEKTVLYRPLG